MPAAVSPYRVFSEKSFCTDFTAYATKEAAAAKIEELKQKHGKLLARVVERKGNFVIYFEEANFKTIFGQLPPKPAGEGKPASASMSGTPVKPIGAKADKPASKPAPAGSTKTPIKLSGPFGSGKPVSKPPPAEKGPKKVEKAASKTTSKPTPSARGGTPKPPPPEKRGLPAPGPVFYGRPPPYLFARLSKDAQRYYLAKDEEFERLGQKQVDKFVEIFNAEMLKFDVNFEQERPVMGRIREIQGILNKLKIKFDDEIVARFLAEKVKAPLENGKFVKVLQKYEGYNGRTVAEAIIKEIGRSRKDCPLSEIALEKEIAKIILEKFPEKYKEDR